MSRRIVIIQGHPDPETGHFCHALAAAYERGAEAGGHAVRRICVATLDLPILRTPADWESGAPPGAARSCQEDIAWADHLVVLYPLWLGSMPALLKGFFEQVFRPGFAVAKSGSASGWASMLKGKSARIVVTMGMPALVYRWYFGAHSLKSLERNILGFVGIGPIRESLVGMVASPDPSRRERWLAKMERLGGQGR
ncbi:NAD(P)H-dependent oxidoreductase [Limobrevibacterium gyesilva]|uniref:NAD(P)H-dependent oxidoreductase n=1 Tax=Limobrevibacterium gyesilva TaxID=2991712 RepID=A0AA41YIX0_9PROT|nr:NAD(P)H-dependent oxidoreductase [Limobrevibacterium gyesilva]MCW3474464.1 NAD(P)H-dependent oxidoreductase [Limobrevibacterium gyesilva]